MASLVSLALCHASCMVKTFGVATSVRCSALRLPQPPTQQPYGEYSQNVYVEFSKHMICRQTYIIAQVKAPVGQTWVAHDRATSQHSCSITVIAVAGLMLLCNCLKGVAQLLLSVCRELQWHRCSCNVEVVLGELIDMSVHVAVITVHTILHVVRKGHMCSFSIWRMLHGIKWMLRTYMGAWSLQHTHIPRQAMMICQLCS